MHGMFPRVLAGLGTFLLVVSLGCAGPEPEAQQTNEDDHNSSEQNSENNGEPVNRTLDTEYQDIRLIEVADGLEHPWSVAFLPDGRKLVTERPGRLNLVEDGEVTEVDGAPSVHTAGQGGLLDVSLHPDYEETGWIHMTFSKPSEGGDEAATALARAKLDEEAMELTQFEELFVQNQYSSPGRHYGSRIGWLEDGTLVMSVGDRGSDPPRAQDLSDHAGSVLRLEADGSVPADNPFVDDEEAADEIYSYGHRNIQGLVVDPDTDEIWATEHGPRGGDLLHYVEPGNNYGWPVVTQGLNYADQSPFPYAEARSMEGVEEHVHEFFPSLAPSGLALVTTDRFQHWEGNLLAGSLRGERIRRIVVEDEVVLHQEELLLQEIGRIRDVREGPDGDIWVLTDAGDGALYRVEPA